jgi:hypothetical protein
VSSARFAALPLSAWLVLAAAPCVAQQPSPGASCTSIEDPTLRLRCYDQAAGRPQPARAAAPGPAAPAAAAPAAPTGGAARAAPAPVVAPAVAAQDFGQYEVEHPKPAAMPSSVSAKVVAVGGSSNGRSTVTLEGGAVWELADPDALLAAGDTVTVRRAALHSYFMDTPSHRTHRVRRLN